jgi:hypothetical protein
MKTALVIVNGIKFPYFLADDAIAWAKKEGAHLHALFLTSGEEMPEEYAFPSDIDLANTLTDIRDTEKDSAIIMRDQMNLFKNMAKTEGVTSEAELLNDPTLEQVLELTAGPVLLFVAPGYGDTAQLAVTRFRLQEVIDNAHCEVKIVADKNTSC